MLISEDRLTPPSWSSFVGSCLALGSRVLRRTTYSRVLLRRPARPLTRSLRPSLFYAARFAASACSVSLPMAQMKPTSSLASAVTTLGLGLLLLVRAQ
jgi:hypothetical protein